MRKEKHCERSSDESSATCRSQTYRIQAALSRPAPTESETTDPATCMSHYPAAIVRKVTHLLCGFVVASLATCLLAACGSSGGDAVATQASNDRGEAIVAQVGGSRITRSELSHWMATIVGGDYDENLHHPAPRGLVSDPPDYAKCISAIETLGPPANTAETPQQAHATLQSDCQKLYQDLKQQTLSYLIHGLWSVEEAAEYGIAVTNAQIQQTLTRIKKERYASPAAFAALLANREWSLSDELYLIKRDLLYAKLGAKHNELLHKTTNASGVALERIVFLHELEEIKRWKGRTSCTPGYVVPECAHYSGAGTTSSPNSLLEQITASR
jgi:hypothetical protein